MNYYIKKLKFTLVSLFFISSSISFACINDSDTRFFEEQRFPNVYELMTGDFFQHSNEFYNWRINDRLKHLEKEPDNLKLWDDLSVSYDKTGRTKEAIDTLETILKKHPDRYETLANLGTFYLHSQQYAKGLELLKKAIKINPHAHFGREIYQIKLVEYMLKENSGDKITFPIQKSNEDFADYILKDLHSEEAVYDNKEIDYKTLEILKAMNGIGGMLKFGNNDSPILMEAMGDLYKKLDLYSNDYLKKNNSTTHFGKIAILFYMTASLKAQNSLTFLETENSNDLFDTYLKIKNLSTTSYHSIINNTLKNSFSLSNDNKLKNAKIEHEIILKGEDIEKNIYQSLYSQPEAQEDLLVTAKNNYLSILNDVKTSYYQDILYQNNRLVRYLKTNLNFFYYILGAYFIFLILSNIHVIYKKIYLKNNEIKFIHYKVILKFVLIITLAFFILNNIVVYFMLF